MSITAFLCYGYKLENTDLNSRTEEGWVVIRETSNDDRYSANKTRKEILYVKSAYTQASDTYDLIVGDEGPSAGISITPLPMVPIPGEEMTRDPPAWVQPGQKPGWFLVVSDHDVTLLTGPFNDLKGGAGLIGPASKYLSGPFFYY